MILNAKSSKIFYEGENIDKKSLNEEENSAIFEKVAYLKGSLNQFFENIEKDEL